MLFQFVIVALLLAALAVTWRRAQQSVISRKEAAIWTLVWIAAGVVVILPQTTTVVANFFGVGRGSDFVLYASVIVLFFIVFKIFIALDGLERKVTDLVRRDALRDLPEKREDRV